ncbi:hypothetical protein [Paraburkholderia sp. SIMBA_054]|uniref:hypothetical protein n=1 Tax=Paraburkholderia sp. SIMBA_054 TaxID=3085795 RepID=UPI00397D5C8C
MNLRTLDPLWEAILAEPAPRRYAARARELELKVVAAGWAMRHEIEDIIVLQDPRLLGLDVRDLAESLERPFVTVYSRPRLRFGTSVGHEALSAPDVCALLVALEATGFEIDPSGMVSSLLPTLTGKKLLTSAELDLLHYERVRHKAEVTYWSDREPAGDEDVREFKTSTGYRVWALAGADGARRFAVKGARFRARPPAQPVDCPVCGYRHTPGDAESTHFHRLFHRKEVRVLHAVANPRLAGRLGETQALVLVPMASDRWLHQLVHERAIRFKREMRFDSIQYPRPGKMVEEPAMVGFLFINDGPDFPPHSVVGAGAFVKREERWELNWIWVIPAARRKGVLRARWPALVDRFGDFDIEAPLSDAMAAFVRSHGCDRQKAGLLADQ